MQHDIEKSIDPVTNTLEASMASTPAVKQKSGPQKTGSFLWVGCFWAWFKSWLRSATFTPEFLPEPWSAPIFGYILAVLAQFAAIALVIILLQVFPTFRFPESISLVVILLIALGWGVGPSFVATVVAAAVIGILVVPPSISPALAHQDNVAGAVLLFIVGAIVCVLTSRVQRISLTALALSRRQQAIIEAIPDSLIIYDREGKAIEFNQAARSNLSPEYRALAVSDMEYALQLRTLNNDTLPRESYPLDLALRGEHVTNLELRYHPLGDQQGQERFVSVSSSPLPAANGKDIEGVVVVTHDISPLRHLEREARARAQQLETIFQAIADAVFILYTDGTPPQLNDAARALLDIPADADLDFNNGIPFELLDEQGAILPHDQWPERSLFEGMSLQGPTAPDVLLRTNSGKTTYINVSGAPLYDPDGQIHAVVLVCRDVTKRHHFEERIRSSLDALLLMAQAMVQGAEMETATGVEQTSAEPSDKEQASFRSHKMMQRLAELTREVLGCERLGIIGVEPETKLLRPLAVVGLSPELEQQWWQEQEAQEVRLGDHADPALMEQFLADGVMLIDMTQPPYNSQPNPYNVHQMLLAPLLLGTRMLGLLSLDYGAHEHNYTPDELELTKAVSRLAAFIMERDHLLAETALARANELTAIETTRRMDEFIGIASHEMKTPLTTVKGNIQLAQYRLKRMLHLLPPEDEEDGHRNNLEELHMLLGRAERQANIQNRLISDLLDVSRIAATTLEMHLAPADLAQIVSDVVDDQRIATPNREIQIKLPAKNVSVEVDADRIGQVVNNYLSNALKYSTSDSPVEVRLTVEGASARVSVRDRGPGISPEAQKRIWDRFYRVPDIKVSSGSGIGLGLGLYICRTIIEQHQGSVGVASKPGRGSTFWFTLPIANQ
jgi:signal transduction histidine kinase/PAS domain-containing protein